MVSAEAPAVLSRLKQLADKVGVLFTSRYLLLTNTAITVGLSCSGDALQQNYQKFKKERIRLDKRRSGNVALTGLLIGPFCHFWYLYLDKWLPGRTFRIIAKKLIVDQLICSPVVIGSYLAITSWCEGQRGIALKQELIEKGKTLYKADWVVWPVAQTVNFYFLPTKYRVLYDNTISFGFDCYFAHVKFGTEIKTEEDCDTCTSSSDGTETYSIEEVDHIFCNRTKEMDDLTRHLMQNTCCSMPYIHMIRTTVCNHKCKTKTIHKPGGVDVNSMGAKGYVLDVHLKCDQCGENEATTKS